MEWDVDLSLNIFGNPCNVLDAPVGGAYGIEIFSLNPFFKIQVR
jgi:hypothetical protein